MEHSERPLKVGPLPGQFQRKERKVCAQCGKEFVGVLRAKYCSQLCINAAYRERNREELNRKRREKYRRQKGHGGPAL